MPEKKNALKDMLMELVFKQKKLPESKVARVPTVRGIGIGRKNLEDTPFDILRVQVDDDVDLDMLEQLLSSPGTEAKILQNPTEPELRSVGGLRDVEIYFRKRYNTNALDAEDRAWDVVNLPEEERRRRRLMEHLTLNKSAVKDAEDYLISPSVIAGLGLEKLRRTKPDEARFYDQVGKGGITGLMPGVDMIPGIGDAMGLLDLIFGGVKPDAKGGNRLDTLKQLLMGKGVVPGGTARVIR